MGQIADSFLDLAEDMAKRHIPMTMEDCAKRIDKFLNLTDRPVLTEQPNMLKNTLKLSLTNIV